MCVCVCVRVLPVEVDENEAGFCPYNIIYYFIIYYVNKCCFKCQKVSLRVDVHFSERVSVFCLFVCLLDLLLQ